MRAVRLFLLMFFILLIGNVSALEFDNVKTYNVETQTATITNAFGFGDTIAELTLNTPVKNYVIRGEDRLVAEFKINNIENYENVFNELEFYNIKKGFSKFERNFVYKYETLEPSQQSVWGCEGKETPDCKLIQTGTTTIYKKIWTELDDKAMLPKGEITIGIFTDVFEGDNIEWIPTLYNKRIDEWASWTEGFNSDLLGYWNMTTDNGQHINATVGGINGSTQGGITHLTTGCLLDGCYNFDGVDDWLNLTTTDGLNSVKNFSLSFWIKANQSGGSVAGYLFFKESGGNEYWLHYISSNGSLDKVKFGYENDADVISDLPYPLENYPLENDWQHYVITINDSDMTAYWNGTKHSTIDTTLTPLTTNIPHIAIGSKRTAAGNYFKGWMDEIGMWNRTLTPSEVTDLYNGGTGITYQPTSIEASHSFPPDRNVSLEGQITFECNSTATATTLGNSIIRIYNGTTLNFTQTKIISGVINSSRFYTNLSGFGNYSWSCFTNNSGDSVSSITGNRTINITAVFFDAEHHINVTTEGNIVYFETNITIPTGKAVTQGNLIYNFTTFTGSVSSIGADKYKIFRNIEVPLVPSQTNITFWWNILLDDNSATNSSKINQSILNFGLDNCSSNSEMVLNYSLKDENTQNALVGIIDVDVDISVVGSTTSIANFSGRFADTNNATVCIGKDAINNTVFRLDATTRYEAVEHVVEYHNIQNFSMTNNSIPQNINLFDLNTTSSQEFLITFKDENFVLVEDALIDISRFYVNDGVFRSVEVQKTDLSGQALGHLILGDVIYTIIVSKNGKMLATFDNIVAVCEDVSSGNCRINLNAFSTSINPKDFSKVDNINFILSFNEDTRTITSIFNTVDGSVITAYLNGTKFDRFGNNTACSSSITTSSGTLNCVVPQGFGNVTILAELYSSADFVGQTYFTIKQDANDIFGYTGIFILFILFCTIPLMLISSEVGVVIGGIIGLILAAILNLYEGGSIVGVGSTILWFIVAGAIIIWKINQMRE